MLNWNHIAAMKGIKLGLLRLTSWKRGGEQQYDRQKYSGHNEQYHDHYDKAVLRLTLMIAHTREVSTRNRRPR
jgi:hypothetical protein